jgi:NDP-sugar pyrophosphorylase family protein
MMAVILAGGKGTRLKPFTTTIPKPLLPLGDMPIVEVVLHQLAASGVRRVFITLGHMAHLFRALLGTGKRFGLDIKYCVEDQPLGTAGSISLVRDLEDDFLVMNGDLLTDLDYGKLIEHHIKTKAWATLAIHRREVNIDYGVIEPTDEDFLGNYIEKPTLPYYVSMGIYILSRRAVDYIPPAEKFDMPQLLLALKSAGRRVACFKTDCYWQDIGRFDDYEQACHDFQQTPGMFLPQR